MTSTDTLNSLLRGELAATETYQQALGTLARTKAEPELKRLRSEHAEAANALRRQVRVHGGEPEHGSGVWGTFAAAVEGTAQALGTDAALQALKEGEKKGAADYQSALEGHTLPADSDALIRSELLPQTKAHIPVLDRLMAGLVQRVAPREAKRQLETDPEAMLICAYDSQEKFRQNHLEGAVPLAEFESCADSLAKDRPVIFYCA